MWMIFILSIWWQQRLLRDDFYGTQGSGCFSFLQGLDYANNQVFETREIISLYCEAQTLRENGEAVVVYRNYTTLENK